MTTIPLLPPQLAIPFALGNGIVEAIKGLYGVVTTIDAFIDGQIESMKKSANATIRASGAVIEGVKFGFGIGYVTPIVVIAVGQLILGNPLSAAGAVASGLALSNPIAMTCGAIGAVYYGWNALSNDERNAILTRLTSAFEIGAELIKAVLNYVVKTLGGLLSAENIEEIKRMVADTAHGFGKSLSDITHSVKDRIVDAAATLSEGVTKTAGVVKEGVSAAADVVVKNASTAAVSIKGTADNATKYIKSAAARRDDAKD